MVRSKELGREGMDWLKERVSMMEQRGMVERMRFTGSRDKVKMGGGYRLCGCPSFDVLSEMDG